MEAEKECRLIIEGRKRLEGELALSGYKHSAVVLTNAALLCKGRSLLFNLPPIQEISTLLEIAKQLNCRVQVNADSVEIDSTEPEFTSMIDELTATVHGSLYLIPVILARTGRVKLFRPGGCNIGERPVSHVISVMESMGARQVRRQNELWLESPEGLAGAVFDLRNIPPNEHSGRTKAAILAGALARGETRIISPFPAQEIVDLCAFLALGGVKIEWNETMIAMEGQRTLNGTNYRVPADFLEFATLACAIQSAGGCVRFQNTPPQKYFEAELQLLRECGIEIHIREGGMTSVIAGETHPVSFTCPPIYSDLQPIVAAILWQADGVSHIRDDVWSERVDHVQGLARLGVNITHAGNTISIRGPSQLRGTNLCANDLRSAASQLIAALGAEGRSIVEGIAHLRRGYHDLPGKLRALGASIQEI